jgi:hypothetical protein
MPNAMTRPSEYTRQNIMKAAIALYAERVYDGTSISSHRLQGARRSGGHQLPFQGEEGLYFEVLKCLAVPLVSLAALF